MHSLIHRLTVCLVLLAAPDIVPDNVKGIAGETRVDLGDLADQVCTGYTVQKGDTLTSIAKTRLGDPARAAELTALNPEVEPARLKIGAVLWLPPQGKLAKDPVHVFLWARGIGTRPMALVANQPLPFVRFGGYQFYFVPKSAIPEFLEAGADEALLQPLLAKDRITQTAANGRPRFVDKQSPAERVEATIRFTKDAAGKPAATTELVSFDKNGKRLDPAATEKAKDAPPEPKKELLLLLLAAAGGGWLWHRARRSAPQTAAA